MHKSDVDRLKSEIIERLDFKSFFNKYVTQLSGKETTIQSSDSSGWSNRILCCFHDDDRPSFNVNLKTGSYKCFSCNASGDLISFWAKVKGLSEKSDFLNILAELATLAGINIKEFASKEQPKEVSNKEFKPSHTIEPDYKKSELGNKADLKDSQEEPIPKSLLEEWHKNLTPAHYKFLAIDKGLNLNTVKENLIGFNPDKKVKNIEGEWTGGRYTLPVFNKLNECRNVRLYSKDTSPEYKMINEKGYGTPPRLFYLHKLIQEKWENVIFCEGEWDCIFINQEIKKVGLKSWGAVCGTAGAATFEGEWLSHFHDKHLYIIFDTDEAGKSASSSHCIKYFANLIRAQKVYSVKNVLLPLPGTKELNDISDYFLKANGDIEALLELINSTPPLEIGGLSDEDATVKPIEVESFIECIKDRKYIDTRIRVPITISGQSSKTYHAVRSYEVASCPYDKDDDGCCASDSGEMFIPYGHDSFIQSCMLNKRGLDACLKHMACKHPIPKCSIRIKKKVVMEEYFAHQVINRWRAEENSEGRMENVQELVTASLYILQPEQNIDVRPQNYIATGWVRSHPNTQQATLFVEHLEALEDDWKSYKVTPDAKLLLQQITDTKVKDILTDISKNITRIYDSDDILLVVLLAFVSPLWIKFNNDIIHGWINAAIIGDSGTGKSATYMRLSDFLDLGDLFSVLTGTRTGLLYSIQQRGGEWYVKIGRYITANQKIIAVDETQECGAEEIKKMAKAMDEGWIDISQVASGGYTTQTRTLFLLNPKHGKTISDYPHGCKALAEVFDPMFIRRLDVAVFCISKEDCKFYNQENKKQEGAKLITVSLLKNLIYWAWTRDLNQIIWDEEATKVCLDKSSELAIKYGQADDIPLINPADFRNNLARLSTAYAILDGNFTEDYESVKILPKHINSIAGFIDIVYSSISCNLVSHSKILAKKKNLNDYDKIKENFLAAIKNSKLSPNKKYANSDLFCQLISLLQQLPIVRRNDLTDQLSVSMNWVKSKVAILQAFNLVEIHKYGYKTTRKFNLFMQRFCQEPFTTYDAGGNRIETTVENMLEDVYHKIGERALQDEDKQDVDREEVYSGNSRDNRDVDYDEMFPRENSRKPVSTKGYHDFESSNYPDPFEN